MPNYESLSEEVEATADEISRIASVRDTLNATFASGETRSYKSRLFKLKQFRKMLQDNEKLISEALIADLHQNDPLPHLVDCVREVDFMISNLSTLMQPESVTSKISLINFPASAELVSQPVGVVLIIGTWNYPFYAALGPLAGAIAAGNCVLIKPGSLSRNSSKVISQLIRKYFDPAHVACIEGGKEVNLELLELKWDHIMFTGSMTLARSVMAAASKFLTPVTLELGGKNPVVVAESADIKLAARRIAWGKWANNAGQVCISPDHVFVHASLADAFVSEIKVIMKQFFTNDVKSSPDYCRIISRRHTERIGEIIESDKQFVVQGGIIDLETKFVAPTVIDFGLDWNAFRESACMQQELFGPILPIVRYESIAHVEQFVLHATRQSQPLAFYVFSRESKSAIHNRWISKCASGAFVVNDCNIHIVEDALPFGGIGQSGMGNYHGKKTFSAFSHYKPVLWKSGWFDLSARYPPNNDSKRRLLAFIFWLSRRNITPIRIGMALFVGALLLRILA